jgi:hypothetical protein
MTLKKTFESGNMAYRMPWKMQYPNGIPNGTGFDSLYNAYLVTAPRVFGEAISPSHHNCLITRTEQTPDSDATISVLCWMDQIYYPGYDVALFRFDTYTGALLDHTSVVFPTNYVGWLNSIIQAVDGSIWANVLTRLEELSQDLTTTLRTFTAAHFGRSSVALPSVDPANDLVIMPSESVDRAIQVYTLSTGTSVRIIPISDTIAYIAPVDDHRAFILGTHGMLNLVDYVSGRILMTTRCPKPAGANGFASMCWDQHRRRLCIFSPVPDATNGASNMTILGYYPVPQATNLTIPFPLVPPRKGRTIRAVTRMIGDAGEPVVGRAVASLSTVDGTILTPWSQPDGDGYAIVRVECVNEAAPTLTVTAEV